MGRGASPRGWTQAVAEAANWPAARAGPAIAIARRRSMRLWLTVNIPLARNPSLLRPARGHDSRDLSSRDFRRRSWHLARCRAGCQASQGLFPPPLWMRASHVLVHGRGKDITHGWPRQRVRGPVAGASVICVPQGDPAPTDTLDSSVDLRGWIPAFAGTTDLHWPRQRACVLFLGHVHACERFRARCGDPFDIARLGGASLGSEPQTRGTLTGEE